MKKFRLILLLLIAFCNSAQTKENFGYKVYEGPQGDYIKQARELQGSSTVLFIVDFSNSMNEMLYGTNKLAMALGTLYEILPKIPPSINVGLRVYGHTSGFTYFQGCTASKLLVPLGTGNRDAIYNALSKTRAVGWTPITYSLKQSVAGDFIGVKGKKHIILLTDGGENCDESPCTYVIELMKYRDDISIDVIAFDVNDYEARAQLKCTALTTSGKFFTANNASELRDSLFESLSIDKEVKGTIKVRPNN